MGASYLVHDFYQRFIHKGAPEKHYVWAGRIATIILFFLSSGTVYLLDTAWDAFVLVMHIGAGTGLLYLIRWFWWRINAWCEVVAMISSLVVSVSLMILHKKGLLIWDTPIDVDLLITIGITTVCWVLTAFLAPQTDRKVLIEFYKKVKPFGPGWTTVRKEAGISETEAAATHQNIPLAWLAG